MELLQSTIHLNENQTTSNDGKEIHITVYTSDEESIKEEIQKDKKTKAGSKDMASKNAQFKAGEGCFAKVQDQQKNHQLSALHNRVSQKTKNKNFGMLLSPVVFIG